MIYRLKRWWYGAVLGKCSMCGRQVCADFPIPGENIYFENWRIKHGFLKP